MTDDVRPRIPDPDSPTAIGLQTGMNAPGLGEVRGTCVGGDAMMDDPRTRMRPPENEQSIGRQTGIEAPGIEDVRWPMEEALVTPPAEEIQGPNDGPDRPPRQSAAEALNEP